MGVFRLPLLCAAGSSLMDCGPTAQQVGEQVLIVAPLVFLLSLAVQWSLLKLWQKLRPDVALRWRRNLIVAGVLLVPAVASFVLGDRTRELSLALWLFGCSYTAVLLVATRFLLWWDRPRAFTLSHLLPMLMFVVPAGVLALGLVDRVGRMNAEDVFALPGFGGFVTGGLYLALIVEALIRRRRLAKVAPRP
jgi:hypothetical protein